jgi:hypothetical protein
MSTLHVASCESYGADGSAARPFASLTRALTASRMLSGERTIVVHGGAYYDVDLTLTPADAGLTLEAAPGETPVLYGGRPVTDWAITPEGWWSAEVPGVQAGEWDFRALVVGERLAERARYPETGALEHESVFDVRWMSSTAGGWERKPTREELTTMKYADGQLGPWLDVRNAELTLYHMWDESLVGLQAHDPATRTLTFANPSGHPAGAFGGWHTHPRTYVVWNTREGMTRPGQWYLDRTAGRLVYWPLPGEEPATTPVIAPTTETLIHLDGTEEAPVRGITLRGLTLQATTTPRAAGGFGANKYDGAITGIFAEECQFLDLTISNVAGQAIKLHKNTRALVATCAIHTTGAGGVMCSGGQANRITGCHIHHIGVQFPSGIGIYASGTELHIDHNNVHDTSYSGLNCGSVRGIIEHNQIARVMQVLRDGAAIYFFGGKEMVVRRNVVRDIGGGECHAYYPDEQCEHCIVEENLAINVAWPSHNHMARGCAVRRNVFVNAGPIRLTFMRCEDFTVAENVIVAQGEIRFSTPAGGVSSLPDNILWSTTGEVVWETLQPDGYSHLSSAALLPREGTLFADPEFVDAAREDFRYRDGSPAKVKGLPELGG